LKTQIYNILALRIRKSGNFSHLTDTFIDSSNIRSYKFLERMIFMDL